MKKLSVLAILLLIIGMLTVPALAAQSATMSVSVSNGTVHRGDTFTVTVSTTAVENCKTGGFNFDYNTNIFEFVSGNALVAGYMSAGVTPMFGKLSGYFMSPMSDITVQGAIFQITLKVKEAAAYGNYTIGGTPSLSAADGDVSCSASGATVTVACNHSWSEWSGTQATCGVAGNLTRNCSKCNATETSTPAATGNHSYGAWQDPTPSTHKHICSVCSYEETADHTWDDGQITKQPTCNETGAKRYTCTGCSAAKSEPLATTNDHTYGSWSKVNDTQHKHTCTVCSKEEIANHTWDNGQITKQPNCKEDGIKTYTCTGCSATKTESVVKTNTHTYGNWSKVDDTQHKHTCTVCSKEETANHTWDEGKITKQPNCKEDGVKTYTCAGCSATKTESVAKTNTHTYGNWSNVNNTQHKHTCTVCSKEETANHSWDMGKVTKAATCKETGIFTFGCTECSATKDEVIEKLTTHTYDHACDTDCNVCGVNRSITHDYQTAWSSNSQNHWHECSVCKDKQDEAAHKPGAEPTEYDPQTCTVCGYVIKPALGHKHNFNTNWITDETGHWYPCSGCNEKDSYADHDFENDCDTDCSVCGYTRQIEHAFSETWSTDESGHWLVCTKCEYEQEKEAHLPGAEATATTAQTCTVCDYEIEPALGVPETTTEATEPTNTGTDAPTDENEGGSQTWLLTIVATVAVAAGAGAVVIFKKKIV